MLVNYTKENAGVLNIPYKTQDDKEKQEKQNNNGTPKFVSLAPGINEITDAKWNRLRENADVKKMLVQKELVLINAEVVKKEGKPDKDLSTKDYKDLSARDQLDLIKDTDNPKLLKKWKKVTKEGAMAALADKIDRVTHPEKYQNEDDED